MIIKKNKFKTKIYTFTAFGRSNTLYVMAGEDGESGEQNIKNNY